MVVLDSHHAQAADSEFVAVAGIAAGNTEHTLGVRTAEDIAEDIAEGMEAGKDTVQQGMAEVGMVVLDIHLAPMHSLDWILLSDHCVHLVVSGWHPWEHRHLPVASFEMVEMMMAHLFRAELVSVVAGERVAAEGNKAPVPDAGVFLPVGAGAGSTSGPDKRMAAAAVAYHSDLVQLVFPEQVADKGLKMSRAKVNEHSKTFQCLESHTPSNTFYLPYIM